METRKVECTKCGRYRTIEVGIIRAKAELGKKLKIGNCPKCGGKLSLIPIE